MTKPRLINNSDIFRTPGPLQKREAQPAKPSAGFPITRIPSGMEFRRGDDSGDDCPIRARAVDAILARAKGRS